MTPHLQRVAATCVEAAETGTLSFPEIVTTLIAAGFEGYQVDLRAGTVSYFLADGDPVVLRGARPAVATIPHFDVARVRGCIREAQTQAQGYTYAGFCARVAAAGCVGYLVSFPGRRVVYLGRTGEVHTELFPPQP